MNNWKRVASFVLAGMLVSQSFAVDGLVQVKAEETVTEEQGEQTNVNSEFEIKGSCLMKYHGSQENVVIPDGIKSISGEAFAENENIKKITIPEGVESLNDYVSIDGGYRICDGTFYNCINLEEISIPKTMKDMGDASFKGCKKLTKVHIAEGNEMYRTDDEGSIYEFDNDSEEWKVFRVSPEVTNWVVPSFMSTLNGTDVWYLESEQQYEYSFDANANVMDDTDKLETITIHKDITKIDFLLLKKCENLKNIVIDNDNEKFCLNEGGIYDKEKKTLLFVLKNTKQLVIPEGVETVREGALSYCNELEYIKLPSTFVKVIMWRSIDCTNVLRYEVDPENTEFSTDAAGNLYSKDKECLYYFVNTQDGNCSVQPGTKIISSYALEYCNEVKSITLPSTIEEICCNLSNISTIYGFEGTQAETEAKERDIPFVALTEENNEEQFYRIEDGVLKEYYGKKTEIEIPSGIKKIDGVSSDIEKVIIPEGVEEIGEKAFYECTNLKEVVLPSTLKTIGENAFNGCTNLTKITFPSALETIGSGAFSECSNLKEVVLPSTLKTIGENAFNGCTNLTKITFPSALETIGSGAFSECSNLKEVILPSTLKTIADSTFKSCTNLTKITLPTTLKKIGYQAFEYCTNLKEITFPDGLEEIDMWAFCNCEKLEKINIPSSVKTLSGYSFSGCSKIENFVVDKANKVYISVKGNIYNKKKTVLIVAAKQKETISFPSTLTTIEGHALSGNTKLKNITLPNNVKKIEFRAFLGCENLKKITIKSKKIEFVDTAFDGCNNLETVNIPETTKVSIEQTEGSVPLFGETKWLKNEVKKKKFVTIGTMLLSSGNCKGKITIPKNINTIWRNAFSCNEKITSVTIPKNVTEINTSAFSYCTKLKEVKIKGKIKTIRSFSNCSALKKVSLPNTLKTIGSFSFYGCKNLPKITIPKNVTEIENSAFTDCEKLKTIVIKSKKLKKVGNYSFSNINAKAVIKVPKSKLKAYKKLFKDSGLPATVKIIGY